MNKKQTYLPLLIIAFIILNICSISSCLTIDDSSEQEALFNKAVDTIFSKKIQAFNEDLDSICSAQMDSLILRNIDSVKQVRLKEIEKLTNK